MNQWQPIETAPDNEMLMLFEPHSMVGFIFVGRKNLDGVWINNLDLEEQKPTHWMPLSPPPVN